MDVLVWGVPLILVLPDLPEPGFRKRYSADSEQIVNQAAFWLQAQSKMSIKCTRPANRSMKKGRQSPPDKRIIIWDPKAVGGRPPLFGLESVFFRLNPFLVLGIDEDRDFEIAQVVLDKGKDFFPIQTTNTGSQFGEGKACDFAFFEFVAQTL